MKYLQIPNSDLLASNIALGCMRDAALTQREAQYLIESAVGMGVNFFDHADIYAGGRAEAMFGEVLKCNPSLRRQIILQTKCGIVPGQRYDFSKKHILEAVEGSLRRLNADTIDVLLLHRPDALMDPDTVASAFRALRESGKVRYFGVSNFNAAQIELLKSAVTEPILFNQLQMSVAHCPMIDVGLNVNSACDAALDRDGSTLDYCRLKGITVQPWSIMQVDFERGSFLDNPEYPALNDKLAELGEVYGLTKNAVAVAWLLRHPAKFLPIAGTASVKHLAELCAASEVRISRQHWYDLYLAAGKLLP